MDLFKVFFGLLVQSLKDNKRLGIRDGRTEHAAITERKKKKIIFSLLLVLLFSYLSLTHSLSRGFVKNI